ncbi:survival motor neuron-like protein [Anaeramoeba flamelloides]|uniref:Survival motor neuron-like protein n=1 Tax=Anaeramoeba flamelloides TaxID=1746091 RepID=A0ABQ8Z9R9_9EUKA|nr:survival motor neuron-like protein [Anaeramoeba flamelloides]
MNTNSIMSTYNHLLAGYYESIGIKSPDNDEKDLKQKSNNKEETNQEEIQKKQEQNIEQNLTFPKFIDNLTLTSNQDQQLVKRFQDFKDQLKIFNQTIFNGKWDRIMNLIQSQDQKIQKDGDTKNEIISNLLISWYYAGYYTGLLQGSQFNETKEKNNDMDLENKELTNNNVENKN